MTEENNTTDDIETTSEENIEPPVTSEENGNTTTQTNRPKRNRRPVERLHPHTTHVNTWMESKREQTNILRVRRTMFMHTTILSLLF